MIYGLFLPYHKSEILDSSDYEYKHLPDYPREFRRIRIYKTAQEQLEAFANTICLASQTFTCEERDYDKKIMELHQNFDDEDWLNKYINPYL